LEPDSRTSRRYLTPGVDMRAVRRVEGVPANLLGTPSDWCVMMVGCGCSGEEDG
jgi:hypothetical protein